MYVIKAIRDKNGRDRTDGRYPLRIGRRCLIRAAIGEQAGIQYCPREEEEYKGILFTSKVDDIVIQEDAIIVCTMNSIYMFQLENER